ncbi:MAG: GlmU family protein [Bacteroidetes bacterium]|nr:GlmU family protein [Bacteroidota bacterium]MCW5894518.1 GlmU family protein [Bacteroidota bacterium]
MAPTICIFEDPQYVNLLPLVYTRPVYDLRCGILTLREKILRAYPKTQLALLCRPYLAEVVRRQNPGVEVNEVHESGCLLINGRLLAGTGLAKQIPIRGDDAVYLSGNTVVAVRINAGRHRSLKHDFSEVFDAEHFSELEKVQVDVNLIRYPWDLVQHNGEQIAADYKSITLGKKSRGIILPGVHFINKRRIFIDTGAQVKAGAVLDASNGPIYVGKNAEILPNAVIEGPASIGMGTRIKIGAKIYERTSIGEMCKVGGEVEASIIHSYSNKQHDGFLGHSYLGMWCNLGADTNTSDLKNNYGNVRVTINGREVDSGSQFVGLTMGDHSKSGINTMFNTGTVVGVSSNVYGAGFPPKTIPSFSWGGAEGLMEYRIDSAIDVCRRVMARRAIEMTEADEKLMKTIFDLTKKEREAL